MAFDQNSVPDPDVTVPAAVRAAALRADELHRSMFPQEAPPAGEPQPDAPAPETHEEQPRQEAREEQPRQDAPKREAPKKTSNEQPDPDFERRFKSMEGRYKKQIEDLSAANQQLLARLEEVSRQSAPAQSTLPVKLLTPEEEAEYGPDFLNVVSKRAQEQMAPLLEKIETLQAQLAGVGQNMQQSARQAMLSSMDAAIPTWREINEDQDFLAWLALPDPYSGAIRHELLKAAYQSNNSSRLANFFHGFLAERAALSPVSSQPQSQPAPAGKTPLENLAAPGRARSTAGNAPPVEKPIFTHAQVAQFYVDVRSGKFSGKDADKNRLEQQIIEAGSDGRIR